jgi:putative hemolysin
LRLFNSNATRRPKTAAGGMANPASVYCLQKGRSGSGAKPARVRTECKLPGGEVIDEWDLYRRDHPQPAR